MEEARITVHHVHRNLPAPWFSILISVPLKLPASTLVHKGNSLTCKNEEG